MTEKKEKRIGESVKELLLKVKETFSEEPLIYETFETCYTNTLDTTVRRKEDGTVHVITGDIPAMWQRDSTAQLRPYLIPAREDKEIADLISGLVKRQFKFIMIDPYANAFNEEENGNRWDNDETEMKDWLWERKYEIDSLCYPIQLAYLLWVNTGRTDQFDENFKEGVKKILHVFRTEMEHEEKSPYSFVRRNCYFTDTLSREGKGSLVKSNIGLTWSGFRPSDDACTFGYLIPSNMFAVVVLRYLSKIAEEVLFDVALGKEAAELSGIIEKAIEAYGTVTSEQFGKIYAYETDGFGSYNLMDDANVPSLLSIPYLGYEGDPEAVENTRKFILSDGNPYFYKGKVAEGIGSPHTPVGYIWHISLAMQGLTAKTREEKKEIIDLLTRTTAGTKMMHEGFSVDDDGKYTREWFSWANAMYSELVLSYCGFEVRR